MDSAAGAIRKPFIEHVYELRRRTLISMLAIIAGGFAGYSIHETLLHIIQKPLGQTLFYTSPTGGFSFIFKLCLLFGLILAIPVIVYQILKFLSPLIKRVTRRFVFLCLVSSASLAFAGIAFAYFISLPAALHFLAHFGGQEIQAMITADAYFGFALAYMGGFAVLFQLPLILLLINRITHLKPGPLMRAQRYVLLSSFIVAAILTPTPDPFNQALMAVPIVLLYQFSIVLLWLVNHRREPAPQLSAIAKTPSPVPAPSQAISSPYTEPVAPPPSPGPVMARGKFVDIIPVRGTRSAQFNGHPITNKQH